MGHDGDRAATRFARGCRCFAVEREGHIVSYGWLSTTREWIGELGAWITPAVGEAYVWNCYTLEAHRRRGHYLSLLHGLVGLPGIDRLWIGSIDVPAEKADADAGFRPVLHFTVNRLGPLRTLRIDAAPGAPDDMVTDARRRLGMTSRRAFGLNSARVH